MSPDVLAELDAIRVKNEEAMAQLYLEEVAQNLYRYTYVEPSVVRYAAGVTAAVDYYSEQLGIERPVLRFFVPESCRENAYARRWGARDWEGFGYHSQLNGLCIKTATGGPADVFIRGDMRDEWDAHAVTVHELRHAAQPWGMPTAEAEEDANAYAEAKTGRRPGGLR